ncbi:hypothetical protein [Naasia lichenicola]|uniref:DUF4232 domain-containing protein n=1 Tax=Naasia lichenicola TaxID=2565933 RepID=A0A4S4FKQ4_9MICO|nr:hypothetical protein [Naasia lichenicola]THG29756.1 hypothetical protein E6C64_13905 [Naasia lichenicola]
MHLSTRSGRALVAALTAALLGGLAGCAASSPPPQTSASATAGSASEPQLTVDVRQTRTDVDGDMVTLLVSNTGSEPFTVTDVQVDSAFFATAPHWVGETVVPAAQAKALRVPFPDAVCGADRAVDGAFDGVATVHARVQDSEFDLTRDASDSLAALARLTGVECALAELDATALIALDENLRVEEEDGHPVALLDLVITPSGSGSGSFVIDTAGSTVLLRQDPDTVRQLGVEVTAAGSATSVALRYVPSRCDPHAVAEDKVGTRIPLTVTFADGTTADIVAAASSTLKGRIFEYVGQYCGW